MSRILIVTNHSYMLYRFRKELIAALLKDHEVLISTPFVGHEEDLQAMGCRCIETEVDRRGVNPKTDLKLLRFYGKLVKREKPDLVITYSIKPNIYMGWVCAQRKIPYFANVQGLGTAFQRKKLAAVVTGMYRTALKKAQAVFFENDSNAGEFLSRNIIKAEKVRVLSGAGIDLNTYDCRPYPKEKARHFLYLGRIMREKGMDEWFSALRRIKAEYGEQVVFDMVGFFEDEYKELTEQLQKEGVIAFHGFQEEPRPYYEAASCVVLPSYHEGMSNVLLEAAATGRPIITSDIPGCRETVLDGKTGFLCPVKDAEGLYQQMKKVMELSDAQLEQMGRAGRAYMEERFEKSKVVRATLDILHQVKF